MSTAGISATGARCSAGLAALLFLSCLSEEPPVVPAPTHPALAPLVNDSACQVSGLRKWYLQPTSVAMQWCSLKVAVVTPDDTLPIDLWIDSTHAGRFEPDGDSVFVTAVPAELPIGAGAHTIVLSRADADTGFFGSSFVLSAPLCVAVTNDWDIPAAGVTFDSNLVKARLLHERHPTLAITHFVGPYAFTDTAISSVRKQWLSEWLKSMRADFDDEIGLHVHPYCCLVTLAGIACKTDSAFPGDSDLTGYSINLSRYTEDEAYATFVCSDSVLAAWGLGKPVSFRAGAWAAALHVLKALDRAGYSVDGSGCNRSRAEELDGIPLGAWLDVTWPHIGDTSQPYYPSVSDISSSTPPCLALLEAPDNGILADYVDSTEMVEIFHANWPGGALTRPRHVSIGYHPDTFNWYFGRLDAALNHIDRFLAANDSGPVVYVRMIDLAEIWE